jgi:hypothetical protein
MARETMPSKNRGIGMKMFLIALAACMVFILEGSDIQGYDLSDGALYLSFIASLILLLYTAFIERSE